MKFFLSIFTFWTSSLLIKVFAARLLSIIVSIVSWIILCRILNILHIKNNYILSWIIFVLLPTLLGYNFQFQQMVNIRMYALAGLLIIAEFYYLLLFRTKQNDLYLIISTILALFAAYTQYYSALISGLLLLLYFIKYCFKKDTTNSIKMFFSGIFIIISYMPWVSILISQINNPRTYWIQNSFLIKEIAVYVACILLFLYPIFIYYKTCKNELFKEQVLFILSILIIIFIFVMLFGIVKHPMFTFRYMYPALLIYEFIGFNTLIYLIKNKIYSDNIQLCYYFTVLILLILNALISFICQIPKYNIPSVDAINNYKVWNKNQNKKIYISENNIPNDKKYITPNFANIIYSKNKKRFFVYSEFIKNEYDPNNVAYRNVYNNIGNKINIIHSYK